MSRWKVAFIFGTSADGCSLTTLLQFLDKSTLSYAGIFGILENLVCAKCFICFPSVVFVGIKHAHYTRPCQEKSILGWLVYSTLVSIRSLDNKPRVASDFHIRVLCNAANWKLPVTEIRAGQVSRC